MALIWNVVGTRSWPSSKYLDSANALSLGNASCLSSSAPEFAVAAVDQAYKLLSEKAYANAEPRGLPHKFRDIANLLTLILRPSFLSGQQSVYEKEIYHDRVDLSARYRVTKHVRPSGLPCFKLIRFPSLRLKLSSFCQKVTISSCASRGLASHWIHLLFMLDCLSSLSAYRVCRTSPNPPAATTENQTACH